jgi:hypothetical protein
MAQDLTHEVRKDQPAEDDWNDTMQQRWDAATTALKFGARTENTTPEPRQVTGLTGTVVSCTQGEGRRWAFQTEAARDQFCDHFGAEPEQ